MAPITLQQKTKPTLPYGWSQMGYWKPDGEIRAMPNPVFSSIRPVLCSGGETDGAGRVMERQPGMSRETTDRERSVLFAQVCVCVSASSTLPAREWLWDWNVVPVRAFLKSETHWHFKRTGDISVANSALFSFYYWAPLPDFLKNCFRGCFFFLQLSLEHNKDTRHCAFYHAFCAIRTVVPLNLRIFAFNSVQLCHLLGSHNKLQNHKWVWAQQKSCGDATIQGLLNNEQNVSQWFAFCTRDRMAPMWFRERIMGGGGSFLSH